MNIIKMGFRLFTMYWFIVIRIVRSVIVRHLRVFWIQKIYLNIDFQNCVKYLIQLLMIFIIKEQNLHIV